MGYFDFKKNSVVDKECFMQKFHFQKTFIFKKLSMYAHGLTWDYKIFLDYSDVGMGWIVSWWGIWINTVETRL